ncbi:MAG: hypothetical protein ABUL68_01880 [Pseudomonadota bacterium]
MADLTQQRATLAQAVRDATAEAAALREQLAREAQGRLQVGTELAAAQGREAELHIVMAALQEKFEASRHALGTLEGKYLKLVESLYAQNEQLLNRHDQAALLGQQRDRYAADLADSQARIAQIKVACAVLGQRTLIRLDRKAAHWLADPDSPPPSS